MAFMSPVPGQAYSVKYLRTVMKRVQESVYIGGHSKGGNLAIYSAMNCERVFQDRIIKIYSMDGPGFRPEILKSNDYESIREKIIKIIPKGSLIGMIFERDVKCDIVESKSVGMGQHNPYNWLTEETKFVRADDLDSGVRFMDDTLNEWILSLSEEDLHIFIDTLYDIMCASEAQDLISFTANLKRSLNGMFLAMKDVDPKVADTVKQMLRSFFEIMNSKIAKELMNKKLL